MKFKKLIYDVSIIVIAKNEQYVISKCLTSLTKLTFKNCEIICVDSGSTDNTLKIMKEFAKEYSNIKIIQCTGFVSVAVARNVGIKNAQYPYIFFLDGDTEINSSFLFRAQAELKKERVGAITGNLKDLVYRSNYSELIKTQWHRKYVFKNTRVSRTGGMFMTTKKVINRTGFFDERFLLHEDTDYSLRISQHYEIYKLKIAIGNHLTQKYQSRLFSQILSGAAMNRGMLVRKHIRNKTVPRELLRAVGKGYVWGSIFHILLIIQLIFIIIGIQSVQYLIIFCTSVLTLDLIYTISIKKNIIVKFVTRYIHSIFSLFGFFVEPYKKNKAITHVRMIKL